LPARHGFRFGLADHKENITMSGGRENPPSPNILVGQISPSAALRTLPDIQYRAAFRAWPIELIGLHQTVQCNRERI
jgi:hypothetical protein